MIYSVFNNAVVSNNGRSYLVARLELFGVKNSKTSVITDKAEFMEAAFTVEKEAVKVAIDAAVAILCWH